MAPPGTGQCQADSHVRSSLCDSSRHLLCSFKKLGKGMLVWSAFRWAAVQIPLHPRRYSRCIHQGKAVTYHPLTGSLGPDAFSLLETRR